MTTNQDGGEESGAKGNPAAAPIAPPVMKLDQFLKWKGATESGGQAKVLIRAGKVRVNGEVETRRGRKLRAGDRIEVEGRELVVPELMGPDRSAEGTGEA